MNITFIGLGIMGSRMAANLLTNDIAITVWNRSPGPREEIAAKGAATAATIDEAVADADVVFSMLSNPEAVRECFLGDTGALGSMRKDSLWVDCSTVNPSFSREAGAAADSFGVRFFDAPVAGTLPQAQDAQLAFFVGASEADIQPIRRCLDAMGRLVVPFGKTGQGSAYKMLVNIMLAQSMLVFSEALHLGEKLGIEREFMLNVIPNLPVIAPFTKFKTEMIRSGEYTTHFPLELMYKDLHLAAQTAFEVDQPLYLANLAKEIYAGAVKSGRGREDFAAVHEFLA